MKVAVIGTGYVGLVSGTCFAEIGHQVTCIDINREKIALLNSGVSPIYEPGLEELIEKNVKAKRLFFHDHYEAIKKAQVVFLAVGTPSTPDGQANLSYLFSATKEVAKNLCDGVVVVIKSTVPVGTYQKIEKILQDHASYTFAVVNNPEFLKEGTAVEDFLRPDRVIIGHRDQGPREVMEELYAPLLRQGNPIYFMSNLSAELSKYAANAFLATKISFINQIAQLCDQVGADINEVRQGISSDRRIGNHFFYPGPGYGGSCFPKDVKALIRTGKEYGIDLEIVHATEVVNERQKLYMFHKIQQHYHGNLQGKVFAFWGVAFKANTDDVRESPAISMAQALVTAGAKVRYFDPEATKNFAQEMSSDTITANHTMAINDLYQVLDGADALVTMTEWREFQAPDFSEIKERLKAPVIFDARNLFKTTTVIRYGFKYYGIGKHVG